MHPGTTSRGDPCDRPGQVQDPSLPTQFECTDLLWPVTVFVAMRVWLWLVAAAAMLVTGFEPGETLVRRFYLGQEPVAGGLAGLLLGPWQRWDALWYTKIARWGYSPADGSTNLFPLYPTLVGLAGRLLGGRYLLAATLVSNLACLVLFVVFYRLVWLETDSETARRSVLYLALFPTAFFFLAPYTESLTLTAITGSVLAARRRRWWPAGLLGLAGALAKLPGALITLPLLWEWWHTQTRRMRDVVALWLPPAGALGFMVYRFVVIGNMPGGSTSSLFRHPFFYPTAAQKVWAWRFVMPWEGVERAVAALFVPQDATSWVRAGLELAWVIGLVLAAVATWRRLPGIYGVYMVVLLGVTLMWVDTLRPYSTIYRHGLLYFPVFMLLGIAGARPWIHRALVAVFVPAQALFTAFFALWYWMG